MMSFALWLTPALFAQAPAAPASIDEVVREALKAWQVPGAAVAIVHEDRLVYLKGFGVRRLGEKRLVTGDTVFPIASCTKSFTTTAMAMLVDEGKMRWDDPVRKHIPFFHLADPLADAEVRLRDLVTHRTGLSGHELLWYHAPWSLEERLRKIAHVKPSASFRSTFQYQSTLFGAAGLAVARASGTSWHEFIERRIFDPLGMKSASCTTTAALKTPDHPAPHRKNKHGKIEPIPWYEIKAPDPAGSINASARDLAKFLRFQLAGGVWQGKRLVSAAALGETHTPQIVIRREGFARVMNPHTLQISYGMGWVVQDYKGHLLLLHGGVIDGFRAHFTLVPDAKLGIVLLNNLDRTQMNMAVSNALIDLFLKLSHKDWNAYYLAAVADEEAEEAVRAKRLRAQRQPNTRPSAPLEAYAGTYEDVAYGACRVTAEDGKLVWHWSTFHFPLEHFEHDTFLVDNHVIHDAPFAFTVAEDGAVTTLRALERVFRRKQ